MSQENHEEKFTPNYFWTNHFVGSKVEIVKQDRLRGKPDIICYVSSCECTSSTKPNIAKCSVRLATPHAEELAQRFAD